MPLFSENADVSVRPAVRGDEHAIARIQVEAWQVSHVEVLGQGALDMLDTTAIEAQWASAVTSPPGAGYRVLVACDGPTVVGVVSVAPVPTAEDRPFDREVYIQWQRFWPFGSGMYTDLFVHRTTAMLKATGLTFPGRVVGSGGIYLEYDGRDWSIYHYHDDVFAQSIKLPKALMRKLDDGEIFRDMVNQVEDFARRRPAVFIGSAFAAVLLAARFLKNSRSGEQRATERDSSPRYADREVPAPISREPGAGRDPLDPGMESL